MKKLCTMLLVCLLATSCALPAFAADAEKTPAIVIQSQPHDVTGAYGQGCGTGLQAFWYDADGNAHTEQLRYDLYQGDACIGQCGVYDGDVYLTVTSSGSYYIKISVLGHDALSVNTEPFNINVKAGTRLLRLFYDAGDTLMKVLVFPVLWTFAFLVMFPYENLKALFH